jgi:hypothetical protein
MSVMKKFIKCFGLTALVAVIAFTMAGCASMTLVSMEADTVDGPKQVRQGQNIDPRSITVWGIYKDGSRKVVSVGASNITFNSHTPGPQTVKIRVSGQEVSFETEVMALRSLAIASPPRTVLFKQGQEADRSWPGLEVRGTWDQMGSDRIPLSSCEITGYMKDQPGRQTIRVSFEGITATFDVDVRSMTSIQIAQPPTKLDYAQGAALELTGLRVMGVWEGFPSEQLSVTMSDISGYNANNVGVQHITVTKNGRTATFDVEVMALTSIVLDKPPTKTDYTVGEPLDLTGIMVYGNYTGADPSKRRTELIPDDQLVVSGYDPNRIGNQQRVTITVRGQIANFFVNITAAPVPPPAVSTPPPAVQQDPVINLSLNGVWERGSDRRQITFSGSFSIYSSWGSPSGYTLDAINKGYIKLGDQNLWNLRSAGNLTWSGEILIITYNSSSPSIATGTDSTNCTITMSTNGQTISVTYTYGGTGAQTDSYTRAG